MTPATEISARLRYGTRLTRLAASVARARMVSDGGTGRRRAHAWNTLFHRSNLTVLAPAARAAGSFNVSLHATVFDPRVAGQLVFEYGTLIDWITSWRGLDVLDVGTGRSTLPRWMASRGARVTTLDHPSPIEAPPSGWLGRLDSWFEPAARRHTPFVGADMMALPFADASYDVVTCFSVLEHLDTELPARRYVPPARQAERLQQTLAELVRVLRPGGHLYLTTECCDYSRATTDAWKPAYYFVGDGPELSGAWPAKDLRRLFVEPLRAFGCRLVGPDRIVSSEIQDADTWTWRGPYFSALAMLVEKQASGFRPQAAGLGFPADK
jgi:SAM-dependent methyltransferase